MTAELGRSVKSHVAPANTSTAPDLLDGELEELGGRLINAAEEQGWTVATAESLTGGAVSSALVANTGSSKSFRGGVVTYATDTKASLLGVDADLLAAGGPVQAEVAEQMARNVARLIGADIGLATTGVAGPAATADGPAGLVYVAVSAPSITEDGVQFYSKQYRFSGSRNQVRRQVVAAVLREAIGAISRRGL